MHLENETINKGDPFFEWQMGSRWNACIGMEDSYDYYSNGYIAAAKLLSNTLLEKDNGMNDILVMPILYNTRHGIELHLKMFRDTFQRANMMPEIKTNNHNIKKIFEQLVENINDENFQNSLSALKPYIDSFNNIDQDGQQFRYHKAMVNKQEITSLEGKHTNIQTIYESLTRLEPILLNLQSRMVSLYDEVMTQTFTKKCSRADLKEIALLLPPFKDWSNKNEFKKSKDEILDRFKLSGQDFSKACDVIKNNRELKAFIGISSNLLYISDENVEYLLQKFEKINPPSDETPRVLVTNNDYLELLNRSIDPSHIIDDIFQKIPICEFADAGAIFYLQRNEDFSEYYEDIYNEQISRARNDYRRYIHDIFTKTTFKMHFLGGIKTLGNISMWEKFK